MSISTSSPVYASEFSRRTLIPMVGIVVLAFALALGLIFQLASQQDQRAADQSRNFVEAALRAREEALRTTLVDYASWGAAYENLHKQFDLAWAYEQQNVGPTLFPSFGFDYVLLLDPSDQSIYFVDKGELSDRDPTRFLEGGLMQIVEEARQAGEDATEVVIGTLEAAGEPVLVAAAALSTGGDPSVSAVPGPSSVLVFGDQLSSRKLQEMGTALYVRNLRVSGVASVGGALTPLQLADGSEGPSLQWDPETPGAEMLRAVVPWLLLAGLTLGGFTAFIIRYGARAARSAEEARLRLAEAHEQATYRAFHDTITNLPNRAMLSQFMSERLSLPDAQLVVLYLDLDRFKPVNDSLGHAAGDHVLREVGRRLKDSVRDHDLVARVGGDEFVIVATSCGSLDIGKFCERLLRKVSEPIEYDNGTVHVGVSIGIALAPDDADTADELVRRADIALYQAKADGRGTYRFFADDMNDRIMVRKSLEDDLRQALIRGELFLQYQPRFETRSRRIISFEALVRWQHPVRGVVSPLEFIELAEETGLIAPLGEWVMLEACRTASHWDGIGVSVNVSPAQFRTGDLLPLVQRALETSRLPANLLELELTEGVLLEDTERARETMTGLKALGVRLSIDDFGTGYSSLGYLRTFPFDTIKIDRQFIADLHPNGDARAIVQAILGLGHALGMSVTAEGVETDEQLLLLQSDHCEEVQGYLMSRPLSTQDADAIIQAQKTAHQEKVGPLTFVR